MKRFKQGTAILAAAVFTLLGAGNAVAQSGGMSGHDSTMTKEDPLPFVRDMERVAQDIVSQVKAGSVMDARNSISRLTSAADKVAPHITDTALKEKTQGAVNSIRSLVNSSSPDLFDLEDTVTELRDTLKQVLAALRGMGN